MARKGPRLESARDRAQARYRARNKDRIAEYGRKYREEDPERERDHARASYELRRSDPDKTAAASKRSKEWYWNNRERALATARRFRAKRYGLSELAIARMIVEQANRCAICGEHPKGGKRSASRLNVDHDHVTGRVRGLLCHRCNLALGALKDSAELLRRAATYLEAGTAEMSSSPQEVNHRLG